MVAKFSGGASGPSLVEVYPGNGCEKVDAIGRTPQLYDPSGRREITQTQSEIPKAEIVQDLQNSLGIFARRPNEEINVTRQARVSMERWLAVVWFAARGQILLDRLDSI